jgi:hypothetical protein
MNIRKVREVADSLLEQGRYDDAYYIYDELYSKIWTAIGSVQNGLASFSQLYLKGNFKASYEFRNSYANQALSNVFSKWFDLDSDQTLNEFTFITYGHLQCISYSTRLCAVVSMESVYNEFLILHTLVLQPEDDDWVNNVMKYATPQFEDQVLKKVRPNLSEQKIKKLIIENAEKIKTTDWFNANATFLDYLFNIGDNSSSLYTSVQKVVGFHYRQKTHRRKSVKDDAKKQESNRYESYERYEKYERFEKFERHSFKHEEEFDLIKATEFEKAKYFGELLGLTGKVTRTQVRKKYLELISKYHPDKVFDLGEELKILSEKKTKQLNIAYEWMKKKYNI